MPAAAQPAPASLARRLGLVDAVALGLAAMLGAGVFVVFAPAAAAAGAAGPLLAALGVAAFVAFCNATSSAQLAARHPVSGGSYAYGRAQLGAWWGFAAGWAFVVGKTASCAAMAMAFAAYAVPPAWQKPVAVAAVVAIVGVNLLGVTRTALVARILVSLVLLALAVAVAAGAAAGPAPAADAATDVVVAPWGVLQAAGLLFFAFAGYARIATMGEEVRDPARAIPRAIVIALGIALAVYVAVGVALVTALGIDGLAASPAPLLDVVTAADWTWAAPAIRLGAAAGALGALLALVAGIGRTALAMAREGDLPRALAVVSARHHVPARAELAVGAVIVVVVLLADLRTAIGFSSFGVLLYYVVANLSAFTQAPADRRWPRVLQLLGVAGCVALALALPVPSVLVGAAVIAVGLLGRLVVHGIARARAPRT